MAKRTSLREFQESLAHRIAEASGSDRRTLLGLEAGETNWLLDLTDTGEVLPVPPLAPVPLTREWFRGIANVRGVLYGVVDFSEFHQGAPIAPSGRSRLLLIGARHGANTALLFSRTTGLRSQEEFEADPDANTAHPWIAGAYRDNWDRQWLRLDVRALLQHPRFLEAGAGSVT
ncbi:MAG: chemotaxis protein CheW [Rhodocyclaceae bacterium]